MAALAWLLIPVVASLLGVIWVSWATRKRRSVGDVDGVAGYERFRAAMERSRQAGSESEPAARPTSEGAARTAD